MAKAWAVQIPPGDSELPAAPGQAAVFHGHTDGLASLAPSHDGAFLCTGSWDTTLRLWPTSGAAWLHNVLWPDTRSSALCA